MRGAMNSLRRYADFSGRASRREFWPFVTISFAALIVASIVVPPAGGILACITITPLSSVFVRRLHDIGRSGMWLLPLVIIPACMLLVLGLGMSILGVILIAALGIEMSPSQYEDGIRAIEAVLAWSFAAYAVPVLVMLLFRGNTDSNQFGDAPMATVNRIKPPNF